MSTSQATLPPEPVHLRRADTNERFVAFAFAGADMMAETEPDGTITYATGAYLTRFGRPPDSFVGSPICSMLAPAEHEAMEAALCLLQQRGRLSPMMIRLSDTGRTHLAVGGILLPRQGRSPRLCLTFARPPAPAAAILRPGAAKGFSRAVEARMRSGASAELCLLEISGRSGGLPLEMEALEQALEALVPNAQASELSHGRFGVLGGGAAEIAALAEPGALEAALHRHGLDVTVAATPFNLAANGMTPQQAARALRHALTVFARDGAAGLSEAGLDGELAGYMQRAGRKTDILRRVIRDGRFALSFQPIVSLPGRAVHHYEALIRPKPIPDLLLPGPQEFVMLVEALGLADELDERIALMACDAASRSSAKVGFNISGQSVQNPAFRTKLIEMLANHPACRAGLAIVEMTETAEMEDVAEALLTADALRGIGVPFCLDDFGAGAADMRLVRALTPNVVKLDGSYVAGIATGERERGFIAGMVEIARAVGAEMVAERVETEEEATILAGLGVQFGQGWLFGRPGDLPSQRVGVRTGETESWG